MWTLPSTRLFAVGRVRIDEIEEVLLSQRFSKHLYNAKLEARAAIAAAEAEPVISRMGILSPSARKRFASSNPVISGIR